MTKLLSQEVVFEKKLFKIVKSDFQTEDGKVKSHFDIERRPTVSIFPMTSSYDIYLLSQYRSLYNRNIFEGIAGYIEEGEEPIIAAKRELQEESGISAKNWTNLGTVQMSASVIKAESHVFLAQDLEFGTDNPDDGEKIEVIKISLDEAVKKVMANDITISVSKLGILMLDKLRQEGKI